MCRDGDRTALRARATVVRVAIALGLAAALVELPACLDTTPASPVGSFPCPDGVCPTGQLCGTDGTCHAASTSGGSSGAGGSGSTVGGGTTSGGSSGPGTSSGSSMGAGTGGSSSGGSGSSSSGMPPADFGGEWDMNFSHVSLVQTGSQVSGRYRDWGVTYGNPEQAGTISGTATLQTLTGTFQDNAGDISGTISWPLNAVGQIQFGTFTLGGKTSYPWCGVPAGHGTPLPVGCGWSDEFTANILGPFFFTQVADEATGTFLYGAVAGVVSDYRLNGGTDQTGSLGRFSFEMSLDGQTFQGNIYNPTPHDDFFYTPTCGARPLSSVPNPDACAGGGGTFDGTWFTNLGTVTLSQPLLIGPTGVTPSNRVTGSWSPWGGDPGDAVEYAIDGGVSFDAGPSVAVPAQISVSWTDSSPLGGGTLSGRQADEFALSFVGQAANNALWCGVNFGPDPFATQWYAGTQWLTEPVGTLFPGCGLTGDQWTLWPSEPGASGAPPGQLVQTRDAVAGTTDLAELVSVVGTVIFVPPDGGVGPRTVVSGTWSDSATDAGGGFSWFLDAQDQTFSGDFTLEPSSVGGSTDGGAFAWCGSSLGATQPSPCFQ